MNFKTSPSCCSSPGVIQTPFWYIFISSLPPLYLIPFHLPLLCFITLLFFSKKENVSFYSQSVPFLLSFPSCLIHNDIFVHAMTSLLFLLFPLGYFDLLFLCLFYTFLFLPPETHQSVSHPLLLTHLSSATLIYSCCTKLVSCVGGFKACSVALISIAVSAGGYGQSTQSP